MTKCDRCGYESPIAKEGYGHGASVDSENCGGTFQAVKEAKDAPIAYQAYGTADQWAQLQNAQPGQASQQQANAMAMQQNQAQLANLGQQLGYGQLQQANQMNYGVQHQIQMNQARERPLRERIAELEKSYDRCAEERDELKNELCKKETLEYAAHMMTCKKAREWETSANDARVRANALADECGRLKDENTRLLAENARLRRGR